jgi:PDZ domain
VEAGLPADKAGMRPGDYIIFVDNYNVVTMPEEEILNFIRSVFFINFCFILLRASFLRETENAKERSFVKRGSDNVADVTPHILGGTKAAAECFRV